MKWPADNSDQLATEVVVEIQNLLSIPITVQKSVYREGRFVSIQTSPSQRIAQSAVDLIVSIFPRHAPAVKVIDDGTKQSVLGTFSQQIQDARFQLRVAACQALGTLGEVEARPILIQAADDPHEIVRDAAQKALLALESPRLRGEDLAGVDLLLWKKKTNYLGDLFSQQRTNHRGQALFPAIPADGVYSFTVLFQVASASVNLNSKRSRAAAARSKTIAIKDLPMKWDIGNEGDVTCLCYPNRVQGKQQVILECRSISTKLNGGFVFLKVLDPDTGDEVPWTGEKTEQFIKLSLNKQGILTGHINLSKQLDLKRSYTLDCVPIYPPIFSDERKVR